MSGSGVSDSDGHLGSCDVAAVVLSPEPLPGHMWEAAHGPSF